MASGKGFLPCRGRREIWSLVDRYKKEFPIVNECRWCYNVIYNCEPLSLLGNAREVEHIGQQMDKEHQKVLQLKTIVTLPLILFLQHGKAQKGIHGNENDKCKWVYGLAGLLLLLAVAVFGESSYGAKLSLRIAGFGLQPSEFVPGSSPALPAAKTRKVCV